MAASYFGSYTSAGMLDGKTDFDFYITSDNSSYLHKVVFKLGTYSKTFDKVKGGVSTSFIPPQSWLNAIPNATSKNGTITITTYKSDYSTKVGSSQTKTIEFKVPTDIKPTASFTLTEAVDGIAEQFGAFVQEKSKIEVKITGTGAYSSTIKSYKATINDVNYTSQEFITGLIKYSGTSNYTSKKCDVYVTDSRGRTDNDYKYYKVLAYTKPKINGFVVYRCNQDGSINDEGTYVKVVSSASIKPCNDGTSDKNTKSFKLFYKLINDEEWTEIDLTGNSYSLVDERILNGFDVNNSYNFKIEATDFFETIGKTLILGTSDCIMDFHKSGNGMAIGKASEEEDTLDIGYQTKLTGGLKPVFLEANTDLDDIRTPNFYTGQNISSFNYGNCPLLSGTFYLEVVSMGADGQVRQRITSCSKTNSVTYERIYYQGTWGDWRDCFVGEEVIYNNSSGSRDEITLTTSTNQYQYIEIFYFYGGSYFNSVKVYNPNGRKVNLLGAMVNQSTLAVYFSATNVTINGATITPNYYGEYTITNDKWAFKENRMFITRVVGYR